MTKQIETVVTYCDLDVVKQKQLVMSIVNAVGKTVSEYYRSTLNAVNGVELTAQVAIPNMTEEELNEVVAEATRNLNITLEPMVRYMQVDWGLYQPPVATSTGYITKSAILVLKTTVKEWVRHKYTL